MDTATRMSHTPSSEEMARLKALVPLHTLPEDVLGELLADASFEHLGKGQMLFEEGATDHENVYLLDGRVALLSDKAEVDSVTAGSDTARFPLAHQLPRKYGARAKTAVHIVRLDSRKLSELLARSRTVDYQVADLEEASEDDWMSMLLQSRVLQQVPASNIQRVMMRVEQVEVAKEEPLIRQGDPGDFYYMLTRGRAVVRRDGGDGKGPVELATLGPGDAFGEEALLSDNPRNSTVTMLQDGLVLRLSKADFLDLIHNPLLDRIDRKAAQAKVDKGAVWLDLRTSEQYDLSHLPGAINFPFESLRYQASSLAPDRHYVLYSNTGGRAMAGAFLLTERGFDVSVLDGGLDEEVVEDSAEGAVESDQASTSVGVEDEAVRDRVREAETRAAELEKRLEEAQRSQASADADRQHHLHQVRAAVDQARRKLLETEQQKREAQAEKDRAYAEMERLTGNLEEIENERTSLRDRMAEIEGLDKQLQSRLAKAERELIGERERAESADSSLEDLTEKLNELAEHREYEREQHARERGELKEELTALQLELEQAQADLEAANASIAAQADGDGAQRASLEDALERLAAAEGQAAGLREERDRLQQQLSDLNDRATALEVYQGQTVDLQARLSDAEQARAEAAESHQARLTELSDERDRLAEALEAAQVSAASEAQGAADQLAQVETRFGQLQADKDAEIAALQAERDSLIEKVQVSADESAARIDELTQSLEAARVSAASEAQGAADQLAQVETRFDQLQADKDAEIFALQAECDSLIEKAQVSADEAAARIDELTHSLEALRAEKEGAIADAMAERDSAQAAHENVRNELQATIDQLRADTAALQARMADGDAQAGTAIEQARDQAAALEEALAELRRDAEAKQSASAEEIESLKVELEVGRQSAAEAEANAEAARLALQEEHDEAAAEYRSAQDSLQQEVARLAQARDELEARLNETAERLSNAESAREAKVEEAEASNAEQQARLAELDAERESLKSRVATLEAERGDLEAGLEKAQAALEEAATDGAAEVAEREHRLQALQAQVDDAAQAHEEQVAAAGKALEAARAELERLREEAESRAGEFSGMQQRYEELQAAREAGEGDTHSLVEQLRSEKLELANRLEERGVALASARDEQAELIEALNSASAERETLQLAISEHDDEQARLVDLENQVADAIRLHERELLAHEAAQRSWEEELDKERAERLALEARLAEGPGDDAAERDRLTEELVVKDREVEQLRGVIEEYVEQIRTARDSAGEESDVAALRAELEMVREQAIQDVAQMREQLAVAETQKRRLQEADGREAISLESMRQRIEELEVSLAERQRELGEADQSRHVLEDELEDANQKLDSLQRVLESAQVEADEALLSRREAEAARDQLQAALQRQEEEDAASLSTDLRDERLTANSEPIGLDGGGNRWLAAFLGALLVLGGLEAMSYLTGNGELFSRLLGLSG